MQINNYFKQLEWDANCIQFQNELTGQKSVAGSKGQLFSLERDKFIVGRAILSILVCMRKWPLWYAARLRQPCVCVFRMYWWPLGTLCRPFLLQLPLDLVCSAPSVTVEIKHFAVDEYNWWSEGCTCHRMFCVQTHNIARAQEIQFRLSNLSPAMCIFRGISNDSTHSCKMMTLPSCHALLNQLFGAGFC